AEERDERSPVVRVLGGDGAVELLGLVELAALLERLAVEESDRGPAAAVEDLLEDRGRFLSVVGLQESLSVGDRRRRVVRARLVRLLQLAGGRLEARLLLGGREEDLTEDAVRPRVARRQLDGLPG